MDVLGEGAKKGPLNLAYGRAGVDAEKLAKCAVDIHDIMVIRGCKHVILL